MAPESDRTDRPVNESQNIHIWADLLSAAVREPIGGYAL
jgi:hypothetical protein